MKLDDSLTIRLSSVDKELFKRMCKSYPVDPSDMLREMVVAFSANRLQISVSANQLSILKGVHNVI